MTNANVEQNAMCIIVSAIGNGNPYTLRMYLLNRITAAERKIHTPTYVYVSSAFKMTLDAAASLAVVDVADAVVVVVPLIPETLIDTSL
jgi:hypothetical protein